MDIRRLSLLLPLLSAVMTVGEIAACAVLFGKRQTDLPDPLKECVLGKLAQNLAEECMDPEDQSIDKDLVKDILLNKFREVDENGDVKLTDDELDKFQEFTDLEFCEKLERE